MKKRYIVRRISDIIGVPSGCGESLRPITRADTSVANIYITQIKEAVKHHHNKCTEFYYILEGKGTMELGEDIIPVEPGTVIMIPPGLDHCGKGDFKALIVGVPALEPDDEYLFESQEKAQ